MDQGDSWQTEPTRVSNISIDDRLHLACHACGGPRSEMHDQTCIAWMQSQGIGSVADMLVLSFFLGLIFAVVLTKNV